MDTKADSTVMRSASALMAQCETSTGPCAPDGREKPSTVSVPAMLESRGRSVLTCRLEIPFQPAVAHQVFRHKFGNGSLFQVAFEGDGQCTSCQSRSICAKDWPSRTIRLLTLTRLFVTEHSSERETLASQ